jgi:hypothetical protein
VAFKADVPIRDCQDMIGAWASNTFPNHTKDTIAGHLLREAVSVALAAGVTEDDVMLNVVKELHKKVGTGRAHVMHLGEKLADVAILTLTEADYMGYDLAEEISAKHLVNMDRSWGRPDELGIAEHEEVVA